MRHDRLPLTGPNTAVSPLASAAASRGGHPRNRCPLIVAGSVPAPSSDNIENGVHGWNEMVAVAQPLA